MTNSVPDSFSPEELEKMIKSAPADITSKKQERDINKPYGNHSERELVFEVRAALDALNKTFDEHPMIEKTIIMESLAALINYHSSVGKDAIKEDEQSGVCWLRDAGKLQAAMTMIIDVEMKDDFMTRD